MKEKAYSEPAMKRWDLEVKQCGDRIKVTKSLVILMCISSKTLTIFRRSTADMEIIYEKTFNNAYTVFGD
jgi:hypothetical protein